jgi:hypothetical protein
MSTELARLKRVGFEKKDLVGFISQNMIKKIKIEKKISRQASGWCWFGAPCPWRKKGTDGEASWKNSFLAASLDRNISVACYAITFFRYKTVICNWPSFLFQALN